MRAIDWPDIVSEFALLGLLVDDVVTTNEIDAHKASQQAPTLVNSVLREQLQYGKLPAPSDSRKEMVDYALSILTSKPMDREVPSFIAADIMNHVAVVESAVAERSLSLAFLHSWGELHKAAGILLAVYDDATEKRFWQGLKSAEKSDTTLQRYWYAWWLEKAGIFEGESRKEIDTECKIACNIDPLRGLFASNSDPL